MYVLILALGLMGVAPQSTVDQAQSVITGHVVDAAGAPIAGVSVSVEPSAASTVLSDENGAFRFLDLASGRYLLRATSGDLVESKSVELDGASADVTLTLHFSDSVNVTASHVSQSTLQTPASVTVLSGTLIRASAAQSIPDLLRVVPGMNVVQLSARQWDIAARGASGILANSTLVLLDGRQFFQPFYGATYWDLNTATKNEINRIEVVRSPASSAWGAYALNGVVNVLTNSPRRMLGFQGDISVGDHGTRSVGGTWADVSGQFGYKVSASYYQQDPWERDNLLPDGSPMPASVRYQNRGTKQPKADVRLDWGVDPLEAQTPEQAASSRFWSVKGGVAGANGLTQSALGPGEFNPGSYYSYLELDRRTKHLDFKTYWTRFEAPYRIVLYGLDEQATTDGFVAELSEHLEAGARHHVIYGGSLRVDRFNVSIAPGNRGRIDGGAFVEDQIDLNSRLTTSVGGRIDKFGTTGAVFAPRLGVTLNLGAGRALHAAYNRAYRAPSLLENFLDVTLPAAVPTDPPFFYGQHTFGSTNLQMEQQDAVEVGIAARVNAYVDVSATVYDQDVSQRIWFLPIAFYGPGAPPPGWPYDPGTAPVLPKDFTFINIGRVRNRGLEMSARVVVANLTLQSSYTFQATPELTDTRELPLTINQPSRHQGGIAATYARRGWTASSSLGYTGQAFWADVLTPEFWGITQSYSRVDAKISYGPGNARWELWGSGTDLFNTPIKSHVFGDTVRRTVAVGVHLQVTNHRRQSAAS